MIKVNLDTNIIKAVKPEEVDHNLTLRLIEMHKRGFIAIQVIAANAAEYKRSMAGTKKSLMGDLRKLGLHNSVKIVPIPAMVGMGYLGYLYISGDEDQKLLQDIWAVLFSPAPMNHKDFCAFRNISYSGDDYVDRHWQNHMCDALTVLGYIDDCNSSDVNITDNIFITTDEDDILKHAGGLAKLGAKKILGLKEAISELERKAVND